ncbi:MAG TPA: hypothetical protein VGB02_20810 [Pyrinomonadaceae bacterium]|jgi:hypothetical protein
MQTNLKFKSLPIENDNQKIEVQLDSENQVTLKLSTWTDGLGWCPQKTMSFDADVLNDLQRALIVARNKISCEHDGLSEEAQTAKIIRLPFAA